MTSSPTAPPKPAKRAARKKATSAGTAQEQRRAEMRARLEAHRVSTAAQVQADTENLARAGEFVRKWTGATKENAEAQSYWSDLLAVVGIDRKAAGVEFERPAVRISTGQAGRIDVFWPGTLLVEHKSAGKDLDEALRQADDYKVAPDEAPRLTAVSDFDRIRVRDNVTGTVTEFPLSDLPKSLGVLGPLVSDERKVHRAGALVSQEAAEKMADLFDALNASGYTGHDLKVFLVRLIFCFFADDTEIWKPGAFEKYLKQAHSPMLVGPMLSMLFDVLDTPVEKRQKGLDPSLAAFPYVNGKLFTQHISVPAFTQEMLDLLLECAEGVDWSGVSPAIFGSMFQGVMDKDERHSLGAHYTSETNILRVIEPLFLDELRSQYAAADTVAKLEALWARLEETRIFDPAAGCGNFLLVAYRELRSLERDILVKIRELAEEKGLNDAQAKRLPWAVAGRHQLVLSTNALSKMNVAQCYAIEIDEWPARIAEVALYLVDHLANKSLEGTFGGNQAKLPLSDSPTIVVGNALEVEWETVLPSSECSYVLGNPPFLGRKFRSDAQRADMERVFGKTPGAGDLDYVTCWFVKAAAYVQGTQARAALVSTNSVSQGEQPGVMWEVMRTHGAKIDFGHRSFQWTNEAKGKKAAVHVVVIGFSEGGKRPKKLIYEYADLKGEGTPRHVTEISPYLVEGPTVAVTKRTTCLSPGAPEMSRGSSTIDNKHLTLTVEQATELLKESPEAAPYVRPFLGAEETLNGSMRYCLWLKGATNSVLTGSKEVGRRVAATKAYRAASTRAATAKLAQTPALFGEDRQPTTPYLGVPGVSSMARSYVPMTFLTPDVIANQTLLTVPGATPYHFGVLSSSTFMAWMKTITGRMKSDFSFSAEIVYNNFPWPDVDEKQAARIGELGQAVLDVRQAHSPRSLADLYSAAMPQDLEKAHRALDLAVLKAYGLPTTTTSEKVAIHLLELYQSLRDRARGEAERAVQDLKDAKAAERAAGKATRAAAKRAAATVTASIGEPVTPGEVLTTVEGTGPEEDAA